MTRFTEGREPMKFCMKNWNNKGKMTGIISGKNYGTIWGKWAKMADFIVPGL